MTKPKCLIFTDDFKKEVLPLIATSVRTRNGALISATSGQLMDGSIWQSCWIYSQGALLDGRRVTGSKRIWD